MRARGVTLCLLAACATALAADDAAPLTPVRLILQWTPQSQFAGYYVAREKGFYREKGLDVTILRGGPDRDQVEHVLDGRADFLTLWLPTALEHRERGVPLVQLAQEFNRSSLALVAWKDRGIRTVQDLDGRRVGIWEGQFRPPFAAFFRVNGVEPVIVPQYYSINLFLRRGVDACSVMHYNEYHMLYQAGVDESDLTTFFLDRLGYSFPEDGLYALEKTWREKPDACRALAEASLEGWAYAADHPEEALDIVMHEVRAAHVPTNRAHMRWMLRIVLDAVFPAGERGRVAGCLSRRDYDATVAFMKEAGLIRAAPPFEDFAVREDARAP